MPVKIHARPKTTLAQQIRARAEGLKRDEGMFYRELSAELGVTLRMVMNLFSEVDDCIIFAYNPETGRKAKMLVHPKTAAAYAKENP